MLPLLLLLVTAQAPAVPGETTLVSFCKQGRLSACETLAQTHPKLAADIKADLAKSALRLEALKVAGDEAGERQAADSDEAVAEAAPEPPNCQGQNHHVISRPIAKMLENHKTLRGLYEPRDERFVAKAKDEESHCGYQKWHRDVDMEVINWLRRNDEATQKDFEAFLHKLYTRKDMLQRFPNGFGPAT